LEIIGFGLLLARFKNWIRRRVSQNLEDLEKQGLGAPVGASNEIVDNITNSYWKGIENLAIPLVIFGLFFQALAVFFHN